MYLELFCSFILSIADCSRCKVQAQLSSCWASREVHHVVQRRPRQVCQVPAALWDGGRFAACDATHFALLLSKRTLAVNFEVVHLGRHCP